MIAERSVLKLNSERAQKKRAHWQGVAIAACEQCGRNRVPEIHEVMDMARWLAMPQGRELRLVLSLSSTAQPLIQTTAGVAPLVVLSGPEGGLTAQEEKAAVAQGFRPVNEPGRARAARESRATCRAGGTCTQK